ncbi:aquaporin-9 isoform X2 [Centrocercus urophasianus]|uniref:aquaporin-9 isoform X2 n=1 Tax=Centrocercus urophasianus TaxID=9002 RepID=UPI001C64B663|nr:aquaporin-9 isoform X2 [Centrocercus urophasianus]
MLFPCTIPAAWLLPDKHCTVLNELLLFMALGCGCVGQAVLSRGAHGGTMTVSVGFAMAVTIAVYVSGGVSGGHINPAVSLAMCVAGRLKWTKLPIYILAQLLGAFVGAAAVFGIYHDAFMEYSNGTLEVTGPYATAHIFATYPAPYLSLINGFADQVMSTAVLLLVIFAIFDTRNTGVPKGLEPVVVGLLIIVLTCSLGMNSGCAMNPARDLGPRLFTAIAGWGMEVFTAGNHWWWVPVVAPMLGGVLGALTYIVFIEIHHSDNQQGEEKDVYDKYELTNI